MKHLINLSFLLLIISITSCDLHQCSDIVSREFTDVEKHFIPYHEGDTITFVNQIDQKEYQFYCVRRYFNNRDSAYLDDYHCENGGYFGVNSRCEVRLKSNINLTGDDTMSMTIGLATNEENQHSPSRFNFETSEEVPMVDIAFNPYEFNLESIETKPHPNQGFLMETKKINGKEYEGVFGITYFTYQGKTSDISRIDTLYYNRKHGLLEFYIEEYSLDLVLKN